MTEAEELTSISEAELPVLDRAARPDLYRRNAFRIVGVSVEASVRDISRQVEKLQLMQKFGAGTAMRSALSLAPPPDEHVLRGALHDLNDPERRIVDEFFWFWPLELGNGHQDPGLKHLADGSIDGAVRFWREREKGSLAWVSTHNLAVLHHCLALDLELGAPGRALSPEDGMRLEKHWKAGLGRWALLLDHEPFWSRVAERIRALDDPRLTTGLGRRIRRTLPQALLQVNAALAAQAAERGDERAVQRHLAVMAEVERGSSTVNPGIADQVSPARVVLRTSLGPLRKRVQSICADLEERVDADPTKGEELTRELVATTAPLLKTFDDLLGPGDVTRDALHDEVAVAALRCQIPYGNKTKNWRASKKLLELIRPIAAGAAVRARIDENTKIVSDNIVGASCWYCSDNDSLASSVVRYHMYGDVKNNWVFPGRTQVTWRHTTVTVPRCQACEKVHSASSNASLMGLLAGAVGGGLIGFISGGGGGGATVVAVVCGGIGFAIGSVVGAMKRPKETKPESYGKEFPEVLVLRRMGWSFGERPPNTR